MGEINIELPFLLSDIGSSNGRWIMFSEDGSISTFQTAGYSPNYSSPEVIDNIVHEIQRKTKGNIRHIHYFGTGCYHKGPAKKVFRTLRSIYPESEILVRSDLEAAALATLGNNEGHIGILGTGSSLGRWDGNKLELIHPRETDGNRDPGSGTHLGKLLLSQFTNGKLSTELIKKLQDDIPDFKRRTTSFNSSEGPNREIALLGGWIIQNANDYNELSVLIEDSFRSFCKAYLDFHGTDQQIEIQFNGSIALHGKKWLKHQLYLYGYKLGKVIDSPLDGLIDYYKEIFHEKRY